MNKLLKIFLVLMLALGTFAVAPSALAGKAPPGQNQGDEGAVNDSEDDISSEVAQTGASNSGDAVGGQVVGVVSAGDASVDATNRSEDVDIETGSATAANDLDQFVGQSGGGNDSEGEIASEVSQDASASSGDGVGGSVIGVVTSAGGSADVVAANTSEDVDIETGDATAFNFLEAIVGQDNGDGGTGPTGPSGPSGPSGPTGPDADNADNFSADDISFEAAQTVSASTGDGVGGQVLGIVSAGDASVDATNESSDVDVSTGDAYAENDADYFVGQSNDGGDDGKGKGKGKGQDGGGGQNNSEAEIASELAQDASSNSGDAVAGQVAGVVTSAGGSADLVLANTSVDVDAETGTSDFVNDSEEFIGQLIGEFGFGEDGEGCENPNPGGNCPPGQQ